MKLLFFLPVVVCPIDLDCTGSSAATRCPPAPYFILLVNYSADLLTTRVAACLWRRTCICSIASACIIQRTAFKQYPSPSLSPSLSLSFSHSLSFPFFLSILTLSPSLSLSLSFSHSLSRSFSHSLSHAHSPSLSLFLSFILPPHLHVRLLESRRADQSAHANSLLRGIASS